MPDAPDMTAAAPAVAAAPAPAEPQPMVDPQGQPQLVAPESISDALHQGWKPVDAPTFQHLSAVADSQASGLEALKAGAEGAARAVIPGEPSLEEGAGISSKARQQVRAEAHPTAEHIGSFLSGTTALGAASVLGGPAGAIGASGALGAIQSLNEDDLGNKAFNSEAMLSGGAKGLLLGAAGEGLGALAAKVIPKVVEAAGDAVQTAVDKLTTGLGRASALARPDVTDMLGTDAVVNTVRDAMNGAAGKLNTETGMLEGAAPKAGWANINADASSGAKAINSARAALWDAKAAVDDAESETGGFLQQAMHLDTSAIPAHKAIGDVLVWSDTTIEPVLKQLKVLADNQELTPGLVNGAQRLYEGFHGDLAALVEDGSGATAADVWSTVRNFRQDIDELLRFDKGLPTGTEGRTLSALGQQLRKPLADVLQDAHIWGDDGAALAKRFMDVTAESASGDTALMKKFGGEDIVHTPGRPRAEVKAQRVLTLMRGADRLSQADAQEALQNWQGTTKAYLEFADHLAQKVGYAEPTNSDQVRALLEASAQKQAQGTAGAMLARRAEWEQGGSQLSFVPAMAAAAHIPGALPVAGAMRGLEGLSNTAARPFAAAQVLGTIKRLANNYQKSIASGAVKFLSGAVKPAAISAALSENAKPFSAGKAAALTKKSADATDLQKRSSEVKALANNPTLLQNTLARNTGKLADAAPGHALALGISAQARLAVLHAAIPRDPNGPSMLPGEPEYEPNPEEAAHFERVYAAVTKPVQTIFEGMQSGALTQDQVQAVASSSPQTLVAIQNALTDEIVGNPERTLSIGQKVMLSMVLGTPVSPELAPDQIAFQQAAFAAPQQGQAQGQATGKLRSTGLAELHIGQDLATPNQQQQLANRRA